VRAAADHFAELGAKVSEVSIPMHRVGPSIWLPIAAEGATQQMMKDNGHGFNWKGLYVTGMIDYHAGWHERADELSETLKITMVLGEYFIRHYRGHFYAKAQNLSRQLTAAYDAAFADYDLLLMPTLPLTATPLPKPGASVEEVVTRAFEMLPNTCPFDCTGHPAMSVPCGTVDGLPVGMMLIAKHWDEATIYRGAYAFEQSIDWMKV
jgi:amidase